MRYGLRGRPRGSARRGRGPRDRDHRAWGRGALTRGGLLPDFDAATLADGFAPDCLFVAANLDADYPVEGGVRMPGCGETVDRVAERLGRGYDVVAGKPGTYMLECVERDLGLTADEIVVVGDNPASDVAMARAAGCRSILIGPGEAGDGGASAAVARLADVPATLDELLTR